MYPTKIFGGMGSLTEPSRNARGRYIIGEVTEPNQLSQPFIIVTNGKLTFEEVMQARYTGNIANTVVPVIPVPADWAYQPIVDFRTEVDRIFGEHDKDAKEGSYFLNIHKYMDLNSAAKLYHDNNVTDLAGPNPNPDVRHLLTRVWPRIKPSGLITFKDEEYRYMVCEASWFDRFLNDMQYLVTTRLQMNIRGGFTIVPYGLGTVAVDKKGFKVDHTPSVYTKFFSENISKTMLVNDNRTMSEKAYTFMYLYILARFMETRAEMWGVSKADYDTFDWLAFASEVVANMAGFGENSATLNYSATDIVGQIRDEIGAGISKSYEWQDFTEVAFEEVVEFWIISRWVASRIKSYLAPVTVELAKGDRIRAAHDFQEEAKCDLPGIGGDGQPYLFMATNDPQDKFLFPMTLRSDYTKPNEYKRRAQRTLSVTPVDLKNGEVQGTPFDQSTGALKEQFIRFNVMNDSRRWDITYPWYKLYVWKFPLHGHDPRGWRINGEKYLEPEEVTAYQWMLFLMSQMSQGQAVYADGWFINDSVGLFGEVPLAYVSGPSNPIQQGLGMTMKEAKKSNDTPAPGSHSMTQTAEAAHAPPIDQKLPTPTEAEQGKGVETPPTGNAGQKAIAPAEPKVEEK